MLRKLANIAALLDAYGLFDEANVIDGVLVRCAQLEVADEEDEPEPSEEDAWRPTAYHDQPQIYSASPEFLDIMRQGNPSGHEWWNEQLGKYGVDPKGIGNEDHTSTSYLMGRPIRLPRGVKNNMPVEDLARFVFPDDVLQRNESETLGRFDRMTRDRNHRATMDIDYMSSQQPKSEDPAELESFRKPRTFSFDPHLYNRVKEDWGGKGPDPNSFRMPVFDPAMLRQLFDPADVSEPAMKLRDKVKDLPAGGQLGYALRNLTPSKSFGIGRHLREIDPATNRKKPNFYPRVR